MPRHSDTEANFVVRFRHLLELHGWKNLRKEMEISHGIRVDLAASPPGKHRFENAFIEIAQSKRVLKNKLLLIKRDSFGQIFSSNNVYLLVQIGKVRLEAENPQVSFIVYTPIGEIPFETGISELANSIDNALGKLEANFEAQQTKKTRRDEILSNDASVIGGEIRLVRQWYNLTQKDTANALRISTIDFGFYDRGRKRPSKNLTQKITTLFELPPSALQPNTDIDMLQSLLPPHRSSEFDAIRNKVLLLARQRTQHDAANVPKEGREEGSNEDNEKDNDRPVKNDLIAQRDAAASEPKLGFDRIAGQMVTLIEELYAGHSTSRTEQREGALTIGLYGPWGAGKSTLINALDQAFPDDRYIKTPLNPWKWDGHGTLHGFVRESIIDHVSAVLLKGGICARVRGFLIRFQPHLWKMIFFILFAITIGILLYKLVILPGDEKWIAKAIAVASDPKAAANTIWPLGIALVLWLGKSFGAPVIGIVSKDLWEIFSQSSLRSVSAADLDATYQAISRLSAASGKRFVLFIDDLDRCAPGRVAAFVESIHSLASAGCIVFVACDEEYITSALQAKYHHIAGHHAHGDEFGRNFLDKIIQIPFRIPTVREDDLYSLGLIAPDSTADSETVESSEFLGAGTEKPELLPGNEDHDPASTSDPQPEEANDDPGLDHALVSVIVGQILSEFVEPLGLNIRQVKSLSNTLKLYLAIANYSQEKDARRLAAFVFADRLDPVWLDGSLYGLSMTTGLIGGLPDLAERFRIFLDSDGTDLLLLYQLLGRRPRSEQSLQPKPDSA